MEFPRSQVTGGGFAALSSVISRATDSLLPICYLGETRR